MKTFDLIPSDYRQGVLLRRMAMRVANAVAVLFGVSLLIAGGMHFVHENLQTQIAELEQKQQISVQQREQLKDINDQAGDIERKLRLLQGLRGGAEAPMMFAAIDRSINAGEVWFVNWEFLRAGVAVEEVPDDRATGYFIIADPEKSEDEAWLIETRMSVVGQAKDHSALSQFVQRLFAQPEIEDVRIVTTNLGGSNNFVDFELKITVSNVEANV